MCRNNQHGSVVLAYDMDTRWDNNINDEIKENLLRRGWRDTVITQHPSVNSYYTDNGLQLPNTTLIKDDLTLDRAENEFRWALIAYNEKHIMDNPPKRAHYNRAVVFLIDNLRVL